METPPACDCSYTSQPRMAITGATGFVGRDLIPYLRAQGAEVTGLSRRDADFNRDWQPRPALFNQHDTVIHLAGLAHSENHDAEDLHQVNALGARAAARAAASAGVRRFVFMSTALVHGSQTKPGRPLDESSPFAPANAYAESKRLGEEMIRDVAARYGMSVAILRPPLVYGPGAGGNIARMAHWGRRAHPMPTALRDNRRSMISLANLLSAIHHVAVSPSADGEAFLVSDGEPVSAGALYEALCEAQGQQARWFPIPKTLLWLGLSVLGRYRDYERLTADFELDTRLIQQKLGWSPPETWHEGAAKLVTQEPRPATPKNS